MTIRPSTLADVCNFVRGVTFGKLDAVTNKREGYVPVLRAGNIGDELSHDQDLVWVPESFVDVEQKLRQDDVVICMSSGSSDVVGKTARVATNLNASVGAFCGIIRAKEKHQARFLAHYFRSSAFSRERDKIVRGANIQNLRFSAIEEIKIKIPNNLEILTKSLDQIDRLRRLRRYALELSDSLLQSVFVEMFGDPSVGSSKYGSRPLDKLAEMNPRMTENLSHSDEVSFIPMASVDEVAGSVNTNLRRPYEEVKKGYTYFRDDDVLFAKITPCMENGKSAIAKNLVNGIGFGSTEWHILRPKNESPSLWLLGLVRLKSFKVAAERSFVGSAGQKRVPSDFFSRFLVPDPPTTEKKKYVEVAKRLGLLRRQQQESYRQAEQLFQKLLNQAFG